MRFSFYQHLAEYQFLAFLEVLCTFCRGAMTRLGIPEAALDRLQAVLDILKAKSDAVRLNPNSGPADTEAKNTALRNAVQETEHFVNSQVRPNEAWTSEDLINAGFPPDDATGNPYPPITGIGVLDVYASNHCQHTARLLTQEGAKSRVKDAAKVRFLRHVRQKEAPAAANPADCGDPSDGANTTQVFNYNESQRGLMVDYTACYLDPAGKPGLVYSDIITLEIV